jgi:HK97 family phage major capsid protein
MSGQADPRLMWAAASGANEAVPSDGGYLVQKDFSTELMEMAHASGQLLSRVRRIPLSSNSNGIKLPAIDETSRANGSRWGGVRTYWINEADTVAASKPKFRQIELELNKLMGIAYATEEVLRDAAALESIMKQAFAEEIVFSVEDAIVQGDGSNKPLGFLNSPALVTVAKESSQSAAGIITDNVLKMYSRLPLRSKLNAVWLINAEAEPAMFGMQLGTGSAGVSLYRPPGVDSPAFGSPVATLLGRPVIPVEYAAALGTVGDIMLVDLSQYLLIDKDGVRSDMSMHVRFLYDEMTFRFIYRVDGQPAWQSAVTPYKGTLTLSPYVALATRP